jgi:hypothetical protein
MVEKAIFRPDPVSFTAKRLSDFLEEFMSLLFQRPAATRLLLDLPRNSMSLDMVKGRLRILDGEGQVFPVRCGNTYLAEHNVPMSLSGKTSLLFSPTSGNRFKVRKVGGIFDIIVRKLSQLEKVKKVTHQE